MHSSASGSASATACLLGHQAADDLQSLLLDGLGLQLCSDDGLVGVGVVLGSGCSLYLGLRLILDDRFTLVELVNEPVGKGEGFTLSLAKGLALFLLHLLVRKDRHRCLVENTNFLPKLLFDGLLNLISQGDEVRNLYLDIGAVDLELLAVLGLDPSLRQVIGADHLLDISVGENLKLF